MNNVIEFTVPAHKLAELTANVARLAKRAVKLGVAYAAPRVTVLGDVAIDTGRNDGAGQPIFVGGTKVRLESTPIRVEGGWTVRAVIEHTSEGNVVLPADSADTLPAEYSTIAANCDHCRVARARNQTVIVCTPANEIRQVGSTCLKAYTGIDPEQALFAVSVGRLAEFGDDEEGYGGGERWVPVAQVAVIAAAVIRQTGWVSRQKARDEGRTATADLVRSELCKYSPGFCESITDGDRAAAAAAIEWAATLTESSDTFERNLYTVAALGYIPGKFVGVAAYLTEARKRAAERVRRQQDAARSQHQGVVGDRLRNLSLTAVFSTSWETNFGVQHLTKFVDANGNVFVTKSSNEFSGVKPSDKVTGTVDAHDERDGCKQTVLKRVTVK